nr:probable inactive shikimate kinase like 1, chloroplastic [Tanacetum cinerariifolium]
MVLFRVQLTYIPLDMVAKEIVEDGLRLFGTEISPSASYSECFRNESKRCIKCPVHVCTTVRLKLQRTDFSNGLIS